MLALLLLVAAAPAPSRVRLVYDPADTRCPERARLAGAVMARLGYEPFGDEASETVDVQVRLAGSSLRARVVRSGAQGETGRRELISPTTDCSELFRALELAVAIAIDPRAGLVRPVTPPTPVPAVAAPAHAPTGVVTHGESRIPTLFLLGVGPAGSIGTGPTPTLGLVLSGSLRHGLLELGVGGRVELPAELEVSPGRISTQALVGNLNACLGVSMVRACALGEVGGLRVTSTGLTVAVQQTAVLANLGARLGLHLQLLEHLAVRPFVDVMASLARTSVLVGGQPVWVTSPVTGTLGVVLLITSGR